MSEVRPIRVLVADDDPLLCTGLTHLLTDGGRGSIEVVGVAHDGHEAISAVIAHRPDVVLMDVAMPVMDGLTATARIREMKDPPEVIVITTFDANDEPIRAAAAGASGFLLKSEGPLEIIGAIRAVAAGEGALSRRTARQLLDHVGTAHHSMERQRARALLSGLTEREGAVARLVAHGYSNPEIASELHLSESTVKTHLTAAQEKLGAKNRVMVAVEYTRAQ
ncbi:MAG TPA: response regulator transcription factor [Actinomycetaceae bacterium]|nr:response regulator transcription factor [Actinomycetaceae bacterium]